MRVKRRLERLGARYSVPLASDCRYKNELFKRLERRSHFINGIMLVTNLSPGFDQERAVASLAGLFGIVALPLAAVGLYGVTAYKAPGQARQKPAEEAWEPTAVIRSNRVETETTATAEQL